MKEKWYWIELIGFDLTAPDFGVQTFLDKIDQNITGINILFSSVDFVNCHRGMKEEYSLTEGDCSYNGHEYNEERRIELWSNYQLRALVDEIHKYNIKVVFSFFNFFVYRSKNGKRASQGFVLDNLNITERVFDYEYRECISPIKRLNNGDYYEDYLVGKVKEILLDYDFDGVIFADGISSLRHPIQMADYSDDLVDQFCKKYGIGLPQEYKQSCNGNKELYAGRRKYIFEHLQYEWLNFIAQRYCEFMMKAVNTVNSMNKIFMFNSVWTKSLFDAFVRYGFDYNLMNDGRVYGIMVEDCGSVQPIYSVFDQGGIRIPFWHRRYLNNEYLVTQMELKVALEDLKHISMCPLKDNAEQWNVVDDMPTEFRKSVIRRNSAAWFNAENKIDLTSSGAMYCLSDGIKKSVWQKVNQTEDVFSAVEGFEKLGFIFISNPFIEEEARDYIHSRRLSQNKIFVDLLNCKIKIAAAAHPKKIQDLKSPIILANARYYPAEWLQALRNYEGGAIILFDYENPLSLQPDYVLSYGKGEGLKMYIYRSNLQGSETVLPDYKIKKPGYYHKFNNIWTFKLEYESVPARFYERVYAILSQIEDAVFELPKQMAKCDVNMTVYKKDKQYALLLENNEYNISSTKIVFKSKVKSCKMISKPFWYEIMRTGKSICPKIPSRGSEIVIVELD